MKFSTCRFWLSAIISLCCWGKTQLAQAQFIQTDGSTPTTPNVCSASCDITGGTLAGSSLFHSFSQFNVDPGLTVRFLDPGVANILSRVTGTNPSNILGTLGVVGNANLFLMNPNGIIFGTNAQLNLNGSFVATTANGIGFGTQGFFSASPPPGENLSLLTVNPSAFLFNQISPGGITNQSTTGLRVPINQSLLLVGGNLNLDGGILQVPGGRIELAGVAASGTVGLNGNGGNLSVSIPDGVARGNISLTNGARVDVSGEGGGYIQVQGGQVTLSGGSQIVANTLDQKGGDITIQANRFDLRDRSSVSASSFGAGAAGNLTVSATESVNLTGNEHIGIVLTKIFRGQLTPSDLQNGLFSMNFGSGASGNLTIQTGSFNAQNGGLAATSSFGTGLGGNLTLNATNSVQLVDAALLTGTAGSQAAGELTINTGQLIARDGAVVATSTLGTGSGGNLTVTANSVEVTGVSVGSFNLLGLPGSAPISSGLFTLSSVGSGVAGDLTINTRTLLVQEGGAISTSTLNGLAAGNININAPDLVELRGTGQLQIVQEILKGTIDPSDLRSGIFSSSFGGKVGNITIETGKLIATNGGVVSASAFEDGLGGNLTVNAPGGVVELTGGGLLTGTVGSQAAGDMTINTGQLTIRDGAQVSAGSFAAGKGGNINVNAESVEVSGASPDGRTFSTLAATSRSTGDSGNITIETQRLVARDGADVSVTAFGDGKSGTLTVNASESVELIGAVNNPDSQGFSRSGLFAATEGTQDGGNLTVTTPRLRVADGARISVSTRGPGENGRPGGQGGSLTIIAPESVELSGISPDGRFPSGLFALSGEQRPNIPATAATGDGGNLNVQTGKLIVRDGAQVSVNAQGSGAAGNLTVSAESIKLDNGSITGATASGEGGDITLDVKDYILMRNNSQISTTARGSGNGGNIVINTPFIVGIPNENSDIFANAIQGRGGNINIEAQGIFGLGFRPELTPLSDITASSESGVSGTVEFNTPDVEPSQGLVDLPEDVVKSEQEVALACQADKGEKSSQFIITGRGGLPPSPSEPLSSDTIRVTGSTSSSDITPQPTRVAAVELPPPAQGWYVNEQGNLVLTAQAPTVSSQSPRFTPSDCHGH